MTPDITDLQAGLPSRYQLEKVIARGGAAVVFLAQERHPDRRVAIKVLTEGLGSMAERERFLREIDVVSKFTHPHIVPVFSAGEAGNHLYYVMPFLDGENLRNRLKRDGVMKPADIVDLVRDVAGALDFAHERNVVHRDIKPENVMLVGSHAMVTDFGIVRLTQRGEEDTVVTASGVTLGTPAYMSPEQASAQPEIDGRSDIYALACVAFEMLTGAPPFTGTSAKEVLTKHIMDAPPALVGPDGPYPDMVQAVVHRGLEKRPAARQESATAFAAELAVVLQPHINVTVSGERVVLTSAEHPAPTRTQRLLRWLPMVVAIVALLGWFLTGGLRPTATLASVGPNWTDSVAVLVIDNLSGDTGYQRVAVGITEEVIGRLAQIGNLKVISRHSIEALEDQTLTAPQLADTLGVRHVLRGSLRVQGTQGRVSVQHLDASGAHLGAHSYDIDLSDELAAQNAVADSIASTFLDEIAPQGTAATTSTVATGPGYSAFLLGRHHLARRTASSVARAIEAFGRAIALDPEFAPALASLSSAYALALTYRYDIGMSGYAAAAEAIRLADRAIALDPGYADGFAARGYIRVLTGAPLDSVGADFDSAFALQPNAPNGPSWRARLLAKRGQTEEAFETVRRAVALDPIHAGRRIAVAYLALHLHQYDLAVEAALASLAIEPELMLPRSIAARAMLLSDRADECLEMDLGPHAALRAACLEEVGRGTEASRLVDSVVTAVSTPGPPVGPFTNVIAFEDLAAYYAWRGQRDSALIWLRRAYRLSPTGVDNRVLKSGAFAPVEDDPVFDVQLFEIQRGIYDEVRAGIAP
jgi:serine/threonine-protein kinase